jgi:putative restriction endonuclease
MYDEALDHQVRIAAFDFLDRSVQTHGDVLAWALLLRGFEFQGTRVPLVSQQGIFKPAVLDAIPLSIRTAPVTSEKTRPYDDAFDGTLLSYRYRGTDPGHRENAGLRLAMQRRVPLVYLFGVVPGEYLPVYPAYVVGDDVVRLSFQVAVDDRQMAARVTNLVADTGSDARRAYVTRVTMARVHQASFRERVLRAYHERCAVCRLQHAELLEAAHILPDSDPRGEPIVPNGLALCKLHHAAFDQNILGIRPDLVVEIRADILEETDGPMLKHGLQEMAGTELVVPRKLELRPRKEFLEERYDLFRRAG